MRKLVLSGGPSTGKSTTFEMLKSAYSETYFVEEAAESVIEKELAKLELNPQYEIVMPVTNYTAFAPLVIAEQKSLEAKIPANAELVFMDRCIIDNLGYLAYNGLTDYVEETQQCARVGGYTLVFFCDWLGRFEQNEIRRETESEGLAIHQHLERAYQLSGVPMVYLPPVSPEKRLAIIRNIVR